MAKALFACKISQCDLQVSVAMLCTCVKSPTEEDWKKLLCMLQYVKSSLHDVPVLHADDSPIIKWYVDTSFGVHPDFKSHTGVAMTYEAGVPIAMSCQQRLNTCSSTEAELVGVDDGIYLILCTKLILEAQGHKLMSTWCIRTTRVPYFWKSMVSRVLVTGLGGLTSVIPLSPTKWNLVMYLLNVAPLSQWLLISSIRFCKVNRSLSSNVLSWGWDECFIFFFICPAQLYGQQDCVETPYIM